MTRPKKPPIGCVVKELPARLAVKAARLAVQENPVNAPAGPAPDPSEAAVLTGKYWGPAGAADLPTAFMEPAAADLKERILSHLNAWNIDGRANVRFRLTDSPGSAVIRITRSGNQYASYLGTDCKLIPKAEPTMWLGGFTMNTSESEYRRVVRHEAGHALGMPHEHLRRAIVLRLDEAKTIALFKQTQGWSEAQIRGNVLTPVEETALFDPTAPDEAGVMAYFLPGSITKDGRPIPGGSDINPTDAGYVVKIYPPPAAPPGPEDIRVVVRVVGGRRTVSLVYGVGQLSTYLNPDGSALGTWNRKGFTV